MKGEGVKLKNYPQKPILIKVKIESYKLQHR